jgi:hypothetical protein
MTYAVLAESKWHVLGITADLHPHRAELTENLSNCSLESLVGLCLKKASRNVSAELSDLEEDLLGNKDTACRWEDSL